MNSDYIVDVMSSFLKAFKNKRLSIESSPSEWWFHWDNAPVHKAKVVANFLTKRQIQMLEHPPSPDLDPADFWLFPNVKDMLGASALMGTASGLSGNGPCTP